MEFDTSLLLTLSFKGSHSVIKCEGFLNKFHLTFVGLLNASRVDGVAMVFQPKSQMVLSRSGNVCHVGTSHSRVVPRCCLQEGEA